MRHIAVCLSATAVIAGTALAQERFTPTPPSVPRYVNLPTTAPEIPWKPAPLTGDRVELGLPGPVHAVAVGRRLRHAIVDRRNLRARFLRLEQRDLEGQGAQRQEPPGAETARAPGSPWPVRVTAPSTHPERRRPHPHRKHSR